MALPSARLAGGIVALIVVAAALAGGGSAATTTVNLGTTTVGTAYDAGGGGYLDVSGPYSASGGTTAALLAYVKGESSSMAVRGVIYADGGGAPGALIAVSKPVSVAAGAAAKWLTLSLSSRVTLPSGGYWLGFWYGAGTGSGNGGYAYATDTGSEYYAPAAYNSTAKPPASFPSGAVSDSRYSVYAKIAVTIAAPSDTALPAVTGSAVVGQPLSASTGSWSGSPTSYAYQWKRCTSSGSSCTNLSGATASTYALVSADQGHTLRATVVAKNAAGSASATSAATGVVQAGTTSGGGSTFYEDTREGFPKIVAYRPSCNNGTTTAQFDWVVASGYCVGDLDGGSAINPNLLGMIQPTNDQGYLYAATYGEYSNFAGAGGIRAFQSSDELHDTNGAVHQFGSVDVLNWVSAGTAQWSADVDAYWAKYDGALTDPAIQGIWGDNDFWSDQGYAFAGTPLDPGAVGSSTAQANQAAWDTNFVAHHDRLAADLPGLVIGGNDISSYSDNQSGYLGSVANGWLLPGLSSAGMKECADTYFGLYSASGVDTLIQGAQAYLAGKALDGKQRYLMLNNCNADTTQINEYSLAVATIGGMYYWPYTQSGWWDAALTIAPNIPDVHRSGARNWLGFPTAAPQRLASGLWKRAFQHGIVYANMTGSTQTVDGHTLANETGLFVSA